MKPAKPAEGRGRKRDLQAPQPPPLSPKPQSLKGQFGEGVEKKDFSSAEGRLKPTGR